MTTVLRLARISLFGLIAIVPTLGHADDARIELATLYLKMGKLTECRQALDTLLKQDSQNVTGQRLLAKLSLRQRKFPDALNAANAVLANTADDADAILVKATVLQNQGKAAEAKALVNRVSPSAYEKFKDEMGSTLGAPPAAEPDEDRPATSERVQDDSDDPRLEQARAALRAKDVARADSLSTAAAKAAPSSIEAKALRAEVLIAQGKSAEAVTLLRGLAAKHPASSGPFPLQLDLAYALLESGVPAEAYPAFKVVVDDRRYPSEDIAAARAALHEARCEELQAKAEQALEAGDVAEAQRLRDQLLAERPECPNARALNARILQASGQSAEAAAILSDLKSKSDSKDGKFNDQLAYANALAASLKFREAEAAYLEVRRARSAYSLDEQRDAGEALDDLRTRHLPGLTTELTSGSFEEGDLFRVGSQFSSLRIGKNRFTAQFMWEDVQLKDKLYPVGMSANRYGSLIGIDHLISPAWSALGSVGAYGDGVMAQAGLIYTRPGGTSFTLTGHYNGLARDSLLLTAMDGRQNGAEVNFFTAFNDHLLLDATVLGRSMSAMGTNIGNAISLDSQLFWRPIANSQVFQLAFASQILRFDGDEKAFAGVSREFFGKQGPLAPSIYDALPHEINRHSLQAHSTVSLTDQLRATAMAEVAWRKETEAVEYGAMGELFYDLSDRSRINARIEYYSGGAGPNLGEPVILGTLGTSWSW